MPILRRVSGYTPDGRYLTEIELFGIRRKLKDRVLYERLTWRGWVALD